MCDIAVMMTLKQFMAAKALTQQEMAALAGLSRSYIAEISAGRPPGRKAIKKIEAATGGAVPAAVWFADRTDDAA